MIVDKISHLAVTKGLFRPVGTEHSKVDAAYLFVCLTLLNRWLEATIRQGHYPQESNSLDHLRFLEKLIWRG